jgi:hypothetical protein
VWRWTDEAQVDTLSHVVEFTYAGDRMLQTHSPFPTWYPRVQGQPMVRINDGWFITAIIIDGKVWEMDADMVWEFALKDGVATTFEIRDSHDILLATGLRIGPR